MYFASDSVCENTGMTTGMTLLVEVWWSAKNTGMTTGMIRGKLRKKQEEGNEVKYGYYYTMV